MATDVRLRLLLEAVNTAGGKISGVASDLQRAATEAQNLGSKTAAAGRAGATGIDRLKNSAERAAVSMRKVEAVGNTMVSVGSRLAVMGAALSAAAFFPIKQAADFERAMSGVSAVAQATTEEFGAMSEKAKELGRTTRFTATEAAQGMRFLAMAGFEANEVIEAIGPSLYLAAAGGLDLAQAADIASNVLQAFQIPVVGLAHVTDVLAQTAANSNTSVGQLAEAMKYAAPAAKAAGVSLEEASAIIGVLGNNGIQASMAGTTLRSMLIALSAPTPRAVKALDELGVTIEQTADGSINLTKALADLGAAHMNLGQATAIFRRQAATGVLALSKQVDAVRELTNENITAEGAARTMAETMEKNLVGAFIELKSAVEGFMIAGGSPLLGMLTNIAKAMAEVVRSMAGFAGEHEKLSGIVVGLVGGLGALALAAGAILIPLGAVIALAGSAGSALLSLKAAMGAASIATGLFSVAIEAIPVVAIATAATQILRLVHAVISWKDASREADEAHAGWMSTLALFEAKLRKFNRETGNNVTNIQEFTKASKEQGWVLDQEANKWVKREEMKRKAVALSPEDLMTPEEKALYPGRVEAAERKARDIRISIMEEGYAKIEALRAQELGEYKRSKEYEELLEEDAQVVISAINAKYDAMRAAYKKKMAKKSADEDLAIWKMEQMKLRKLWDEHDQALADAEKVANDDKKKRQREADEKERLRKVYDLQILQNELAAIDEDNLEALHNKRMEIQEKSNNEIIELMTKVGLAEEQINRMREAMHAATAKRIADFEEAMLQRRLAMQSDSASRMAQIFGDLYTAVGQKFKAFFYLQKAAAVAQAIIDTNLAAQKVAGQTGILGIPMTALVYAQGMARVAAISAQTLQGFAEGGLFRGKKGKDTNLAWMTDNEYVMNPKAVAHYGVSFMEAVNRKLVDIRDMAVPRAPVARPAGAYASGGHVQGGSGGLTIANFTSPEEYERFLTSSRGRDAVINVISSRAPTVRRILGR